MVKRIVVSLLLTIVFLTLLPLQAQFAAGQNTSGNADIAQTKTALANAFLSVKAAEAQGADVSSMTITLNEAGQLLSQAEMAYSAKDYGSAAILASACRDKINGLSDSANSLKEAAIRNRSNSQFFDLLLILVSLAIFSAGVAAWVLLGRKTQRRETVESTPV